jgi:cation diffusion facilitator family transporter
LVGAAGAAVGWGWADPVVGLVIAVVILTVLYQAAREVYRRLMDAVDPALVDQVEAVLRETPGVLDVGEIRLRWIGHRLRAECAVVAKADSTVLQAHQVAVDVEHALIHAIPRLSAAHVHADPYASEGVDHHGALTGHR